MVTLVTGRGPQAVPGRPIEEHVGQPGSSGDRDQLGAEGETERRGQQRQGHVVHQVVGGNRPRRQHTRFGGVRESSEECQVGCHGSGDEHGDAEAAVVEGRHQRGVHKTTVYRRWPTIVELVADATRAWSEARIPISDTGDLVGDLTELARAVSANLSSTVGERGTRHLVAAGAGAPEVAAGTHEFWAHRLSLARVVVERAVERGELLGDVDTNLLIETLIGPLFVRLLLTGEPLEDAVAEAVAIRVAIGFAAHHGSAHAPSGTATDPGS